MKNSKTKSIYGSILETLKYFDIFQHPLYSHEIHKFLNNEITSEFLQSALARMVQEKSIYKVGELFSLKNDPQIFEKRLNGSNCATKRMNEAYAAGNIISSFPFVKCVCISGSLSKGYADENSDIDFFIITDSNRLWIGRTLLHLFKKVTFIINRQHSFCMNYFIDESMLCLEEQNIFTATEIATLIPINNQELYLKLQLANEKWVRNIFPNFKPKANKQSTMLDKKKWLTRLSERLLNTMWPEQLNIKLMKLTDKKWRNKWEKKNYPMEDYDLAMKTRWYVSKQHPLNYQKKVLSTIGH